MPNSRSILVVDDDAAMRELLRDVLEDAGFRVLEASDGDATRARLAEQPIDLLLLDLLLDGENGLNIAREVVATNDTPVVIVSGKDDVFDKVVGLEIGAYDYITKPFHPRELVARVENVLRRRYSAFSKSDEPLNGEAVHFNGWSLNTSTGQLIDPTGASVPLTSYEFQVLSVLANHPARILSRSQILDLVADREWDPLDRSLDVLIGKIRKKLGDDPRDPAFIRTMRGIGYMFVASAS